MILEKITGKTFLVFSPHPDDVEFGFSGSAAVLSSWGNKVVYAIVTDGSKGRGNSNGENVKEKRELEQREAAKKVGVEEVIFMNQKDGELENTADLRKEIVSVIRKVKPNIVSSFDPASMNFDSFYRYHPDHRAVAMAVYDSLYPAVGSVDFFPELIEKDLMPHQIEGAWFIGGKSNLYIDIGDVLDKKLETFNAHKSQFDEEKVKEIQKMITEWSEDVGKETGLKHAEGFRKLEF